METVRAFIALNIGDQIQANLAALIEELKTSGADVRWTAPENLHLTLAFLGKVSTDNLQSLEAGLRTGLRVNNPFELTVRGTGIFGRRSRPSVVWAGIEENDALQHLQRKVVDAVQQAGISYNNSSFRPHLTLGRFKTFGNLGPLFQALEKAETRYFGKLHVSAASCIQSELKPTGAVYTVLFSAPLAEG